MPLKKLLTYTKKFLTYTKKLLTYTKTYTKKLLTYTKTYTKKLFKSNSTNGLLLNKAIKYLRSNSESSKLIDVVYTLDLDEGIEPFVGELDLPTPISENLTVAAIVQPGINRQPYFESGADVVGSDDLIFQIGRKTAKFDLLFTTQEMVSNLSRVQEELESKDLMPSFDRATIVEDLRSSLEKFKKGKISFSSNKFGQIIVPIGHLKMSDIELAQNFLYVDSEIQSLIKIQDNSINKIELSCYKGVSIQIRDPEQESNFSRILISLGLKRQEWVLIVQITAIKFLTDRASKRIAYYKARQAKVDALVKKLKAKAREEKARKAKAQRRKELKRALASSNLNSKNKSLFKLVNKFNINRCLFGKTIRRKQKIKKNLNENKLD